MPSGGQCWLLKKNRHRAACAGRARGHLAVAATPAARPQFRRRRLGVTDPGSLQRRQPPSPGGWPRCASLWRLSDFGNRAEASYNTGMIDGAMNFFSLLLLGLFLGMRHATDPDHIVAIATIVSRQRTMRGSMLIGAAWGVGHSITVMVVGGAIILFGVVIPPWLGLSMEFRVGLMLILLGIVTQTGLRRGLGQRQGMHDHVHSHGDYVHRH